MRCWFAVLLLAGCLALAGCIVDNVEDETPQTTCPESVPEPVSGSIAAVESLEMLTWSSDRIVTATVDELCDQWGNSIIVDVSQTWRGDHIDRFTVSGLNPSLSSAPLLNPGDNVLLFLHASGDGLYPNGGPQGHYLFENGMIDTRQVPVAIPDRLTDLKAEVSAILYGEPPAKTIYSPVSLNDAPRGPDLDQ